MTDSAAPWSKTIRLVEVGRTGLVLTLAPDEAARALIAKALDLAALRSLTAEVQVKPWLDGAEINARWTADLAYTCGLTLEPFDSQLIGEFQVRCVPPESPNAPTESSEAIIDLEADDPPDVLDEDVIDLAAYLVEHFALDLDPFPRKPGAVFEPPEEAKPESPFAVLLKLRPDPEG